MYLKNYKSVWHDKMFYVCLEVFAAKKCSDNFSGWQSSLVVYIGQRPGDRLCHHHQRLDRTGHTGCTECTAVPGGDSWNDAIQWGWGCWVSRLLCLAFALDALFLCFSNLVLGYHPQLILKPPLWLSCLDINVFLLLRDPAVNSRFSL